MESPLSVYNCPCVGVVWVACLQLEALRRQARKLLSSPVDGVYFEDLTVNKRYIVDSDSALQQLLQRMTNAFAHNHHTTLLLRRLHEALDRTSAHLATHPQPDGACDEVVADGLRALQHLRNVCGEHAVL